MADGRRPPGRTAWWAVAVVVAALAAGIAWWLSPPGGVALASGIPTADVGLPLGWVDVRLASLDAPGALDVGLTGAGRVVPLPTGAPFDVDDDVALSVPADRAGLLVDEREAPAWIQLEPEPGEAVVVAGKPYRGAVRVLRDGDVTRVVNRLPVEHYLLGVVNEEMPRGFASEALRAQAVAARSWVLARLAEGGTIHPDARSQVYGGLDAETRGSHDAVLTTAGLVLLYDDAIAPAWYHSTCGGTSRPAGDVFPGAPDDYLAAIRPCEGCVDSPYYEWTRRFDRATVCDVAGLPVAPLRGVTVSASSPDGRARRVDLRAGERTASLHADDLRIGLSRGRRIREQVLSTLWSQPPVVDDGELVLRGRGWGHGVGLCQYGADGMADAGASYTEILAHYFPGTRLVSYPPETLR